MHSECRTCFGMLVGIVLVWTNFWHAVGALTEINGAVYTDNGILQWTNSPYIVTNDIVVEESGKLTIQPGVELRFAPGVGITVRGVLQAEGNAYKRIVMTNASYLSDYTAPPDIRLVEGPSVSEGRLQLFYNNEWRSVCTNSRNWTYEDLLVACRHLGFQGGQLSKWYERNNDSFQLLYESPRCKGREASVLNCNSSAIKLGSGVCDNHYDIGIRCEQIPAQQPISHWRGIQFESWKFQMFPDTTLQMRYSRSPSVISDTDILFAGVNRTGNLTSALNIVGIPPYIKGVNIQGSAFNGINVTKIQGEFEIVQSIIENSRGFGICINSSVGTSNIHSCTVQKNGGDGVRYIHHDLQTDPYGNMFDLCQAAGQGSGQFYPLRLYVKQFRTGRSSANCSKVFTVTGSSWNVKLVLTVHFVYWWSEDDGDGVVEFRDGGAATSRLILAHAVSNSSRPQSITTTGNQLYIKTFAKPNKNLLLIIDIESGFGKVPDLNVTNSIISNNNGRGIAMDNIRSMLAVSNSWIDKSNHVAGIHVFNGSGDVNVSSSIIVNNIGDGINVSYSGGRCNVTNCTISRNTKRGIAVWLNESSLYNRDVQRTDIANSHVIDNLESGIRVGNFCGPSVINITGSHVNGSGRFGLEIYSCWKKIPNQKWTTLLYVMYNKFGQNRLSGFMLKPAVNVLADISHNQFADHSRSALFIQNEDYEELEQLHAHLEIYENYFRSNRGWFVVSIGVSEYSNLQGIIFTHNWLLNNVISESFYDMIPRARAASVIAISSSNTTVYRNIFNNPGSKYDICSWLENPYKTINASLNWMGSINELQNYYRVFDSKYRYNLATITHFPFLAQTDWPDGPAVSLNPTPINPFYQNRTHLGGKIEGRIALERKEYIVFSDIIIQPGSELILQPGTKFRFYRSVGMMVQGKLTVESSQNENVIFSAYKRSTNATFNSVRFAPGSPKLEGRLQVKIKSQWGTICNYRWTMVDAALACHQMGYVLNPKDWLLKPFEMLSSSTSEPVLLSNVQCHELDVDLAACEAERSGNIFHSCSHDNDVGIRCYDQGWAGIHIGIMSTWNDIKNIEVQQAGLFDPTRNLMKPAILFDFFNSYISRISVHHNIEDGIGILYNNLYLNNVFNNISSRENRGFGLSTRSQGLAIERSSFHNNYASGFHYNPTVTFYEERQIVSRIDLNRPDSVRVLTGDFNLNLDMYKGMFLVTSQVPNRIYRGTVSTSGNSVLNVIVIGSIHPKSTENMMLFEVESFKYSVKDLISFPLVTYGSKLNIEYFSGDNPYGSVVIYIVPIERRDELQRYPRFLITESTFVGNAQGLSTIHYNTDRNIWNDRYLRVKNESIELLRCTIRNNLQESFLVQAPYREQEMKPLSNITYVINETSIIDNTGGIVQISRDLRNSNNHFHWILGRNQFQGNRDGVKIAFPFVWQSNDSHSSYIHNNTFRNNSNFHFNIDGYYAQIHILENTFELNLCTKGLMNFLGMEKEMFIHRNVIGQNKCQFLVEFDITSQTDKNGSIPAEFKNNIVRYNYYNPMSVPKDDYQPHDYVIAVKGIQKVNVTNNVLSDNQFQYIFLAGIRTSSMDNTVNVKENYWGTRRSELIRERIFDFDDWNSFAIADFSPFLLAANVQSGDFGYEVINNTYIDLNNLRGRIYYDINLRWRASPYVIKSDITIMPGVTMIIDPGVRLEFFPSVGILVLGTLKAFGRPDARISFVPAQIARTFSPRRAASNVRLCTSYNNIPNCEKNREGFVEVYNSTTKQWIPLCNKRFTRLNAEIVCGELGLDKLNVYVKFGPRLDLDPTYLSRIYSWVEPRECSGKEMNYLECGLQNGGDIYQMHSCSHMDDFVFVHCGRRNMEQYHYWGGIRFSTPNYEEKIQYPYDKIFDNVQIHDSMLEYVDIIGAGVLHNEKSAAILSTFNSPKRLEYLNITLCASHGISAIAPSSGIYMHDNRIEDNLGIGLVIFVLNGDSGERNDSTFRPLSVAQLPYNVFGMVEMCESHKVVEIEERIILYFKYYNYPVDCVKIFSSSQKVKPVGFRLLHFKFFKPDDSNLTDTLRLFDGNIYNHSARQIGVVRQNSVNTKQFFRAGSTLSIQLRASGATENHGFIAEIITLPALIIGTGRNIQFNISYSRFAGNQMGGAMYGAAGEDNPSISFNHNQFTDNGIKMFGNFTSSEAAIHVELRNTIVFNFEHNLLLRNQGGLKISTESSSSVVGMKGLIRRNVFTDNYSHKSLCITGSDESIQMATITQNHFTRNYAMYDDNLQFKMIKLDFFRNYIYNNTGTCALSVYGYKMLRMQLYQQVQKNAFHNNSASALHYKGTIFAGGAGQSFEENILMNPMNDFEIIATNQSAISRDNRIDATNNWWGYNYSIAIASRIRDWNDDNRLLQVVYQPYYLNNMTLVDGKCPPGWRSVGSTCFLYGGGVMTLEEAKLYCVNVGGSLPFLKDSNEKDLRAFVLESEEAYDFKAWVLSIDFQPQDCIAFSKNDIFRMRCEERLPFLCEKDPDVYLAVVTDLLTIAALSAAAAALLLVVTCIMFWVCKSRQRQKERLERRNSVRASKRSLRSISCGSFPSDLGAGRRMIDDSKRAKIVEPPFKGSFDSIEKTPSRFDSVSYFNSSIEDNQSYEICEATNHKIEYSDYEDKFETESPSVNRTKQSVNPPTFQYGYDNKAFLDNTFARDETHPWGSSSGTESTVDMKRYLETSLDTNGRDETFTSRSSPSTFSQELPIRRQLLETEM